MATWFVNRNDVLRSCWLFSLIIFTYVYALVCSIETELMFARMPLF